LQIGTVILYGVPIVSLMMDNKERLCLAQISSTLLKDYSYNVNTFVGSYTAFLEAINLILKNCRRFIIAASPWELHAHNVHRFNWSCWDVQERCQSLRDVAGWSRAERPSVYANHFWVRKPIIFSN